MTNNTLTLLTGADTEKVVKLIDEQFNPNNTVPELQELVEEEMKLKGFNPLNNNDVKTFWRLKGIEV